MGIILSASCECGFSRQLFAGIGMFKDKCIVPGYCPNCRSLEEANFNLGTCKCTRCGAKLSLYNDPVTMLDPEKAKVSVKSDINDESGKQFFWRNSKGREFHIVDTLYLCPGCGQKKMTFFQGGWWD